MHASVSRELLARLYASVFLFIGSVENMETIEFFGSACKLLHGNMNSLQRII